MLQPPVFKIARSDEEISYRIEQLRHDLADSKRSCKDKVREFTVRLAVIQAKLTPDETDERTSCGYTFALRTAAIAESLWLYGYRGAPWQGGYIPSGRKTGGYCA